MQTIRIAVEGDILVARPAGERVRRRIEDALRNSDDDVVFLDFRGVKAFDLAAADEAFAKLLFSLRAESTAQRCVVFSRTNDAQADHLGWVLNRRRLLGLASGRAGARLIGRVSSGVAAAFDFAATHGEVRAADLASMRRVSTTAASNWLRELWAAGVFTRHQVAGESGGRAYSYRMRWDRPSQ